MQRRNHPANPSASTHADVRLNWSARADLFLSREGHITYRIGDSMSHRTNFTLSEVPLQWLRSQAPSARGMSRLIDSLIQKERTLGPIESRMQKQADRLDR